MSDATRYVSLQDAAAQCGVNERTVRRWITAGKLTGYRAGARLVRVDRDELARLMRPISAAGAR